MRDLPFRITRALKWEGLPFRERGGTEPPTEQGRELFMRYDLKRWSAHYSELTLEETLGTLDLLDRIPAEVLPRISKVRALDIGSKSWRYLGALIAWLQERSPGAPIDLTGVELAAYRLGPDLRTWLAAGRHFAALHEGGDVHARYLSGAIRDHEIPSDVVFWLFPFVSENPHQKWGLPREFFNPGGNFAHVAGNCLQPGGRLILANQGDWEYEISRDFLAKTPGLRCLHEGEVRDSLHASPYPIRLSVWLRQ